jgi:hypothetical protein
MNPTETTARRRVGLQVLLVAACALALAACGGDDDDSAGTEPPTATEAEGTTPEATVGGTDVSASTPSTDAEGVTFTPPEGDYSIVYPAQPTQNDQTVALPDGTSLPVTFYILDAGDSALGSAAVEYPAGIEVSLEGSQEGAITNISATLIDSEPITLQGRDGLQFSADVQDGQGTYLSRIYADGSTLYQVIDIETGEASFDDPAIAAFFDSFRFTEDG